MLLGPVFRAELIRTPRRARYYALRVGYGLALLVLVWLNYESLMAMAARRGGLVWISEVATFALNTFVWFAGLQFVTLMFLVPALFGGVIADEKQRKTMHYLMASRLSGTEIVLDKFVARMLHIGVFVLLGVPVMSLLSLFGGVPWEYVAVAYSGTAAMTFFAATLSTLISTFARRVRQGVTISYTVLLLWLIIPAAVGGIGPALYPNFYAWLGPVNDWLLAMNPLYLVFSVASPTRGFRTRIPGGPGALLDPFLIMLRLQLAAGLAFLLVAIVQLRPTFRRQETTSSRLTWFRADRRRPRWLTRPECGTDAMLWKELHFTRTDVFTKLVVLPATILLTVGVFLLGRFDETIAGSFSELWSEGYSGGFRSRNDLNGNLRAISPLYIALWLLAVMGASASSLTVERDEDTWTSLVSTPLRAWEIIRGKIAGACWGLRGFGGLLSLFWLVGLVLGAVHPLGLLLSLVVMALLTWAVAALGVHESLRARSTSRALSSSLGILVLLNCGYLIVLEPLMRIYGYDDRWMIRFFGFTPYLASLGLLSYDEVRLLGAGIAEMSPVRLGLYLRIVGLVVLIISAYALAGVWLTRRSIRRFDSAADRPARPAARSPYGGRGGEGKGNGDSEAASRPVMVNATQ